MNNRKCNLLFYKVTGSSNEKLKADLWKKKTCKIDINGVKTPSTLTIIRVSSPQPDEPGKCLQR